MGQKFERIISAVAVAAAMATTGAVIIPLPAATAQAVSLQEQLQAQYKLAKMGSDSSGYQVVEEGTVLAVQKGGILGLPYKSSVWPTATYQNGTVKASAAAAAAGGKVKDFGSKFCGLTHKCPQTPDAASNETSTKLFKIGDKVYATKIDVKPDKDTVTLSIVSCDTCNKVDPATYNKVNVIFQFAAGSLAKAQAGEVEDTIAQVFTLSDNNSGGDNQQGNNQQGGDQQQQGGDQGQQQAGGNNGGGQDQQQQADPQTVEVGMTPDQVTNALGRPDKIVKLTSKQIFIYKDMKVTFVNGKVSDVQ
jgi:hypothetical protein